MYYKYQNFNNTKLFMENWPLCDIC